MRKGQSLDRKPLAPARAPITWQGWTLALLWVAAAVVTLGAAASLRDAKTFILAALAIAFGTSAVLWMLRGRGRPAPR